MSGPCISKSAHNYNFFYMVTKTIKHHLYETATSNSKQD